MKPKKREVVRNASLSSNPRVRGFRAPVSSFRRLGLFWYLPGTAKLDWAVSAEQIASQAWSTTLNLLFYLSRASILNFDAMVKLHFGHVHGVRRILGRYSIFYAISKLFSVFSTLPTSVKTSSNSKYKNMEN